MKQAIAPELLSWYDEHARELPWRIPPSQSVKGKRPDPYRVWLSEVMLQQTTVAAVKSYYAEFTTRWPNVHALAQAEDDDVMAAWAGLGYYARARNLLKCARQVVLAYNGQFPETREGLLTLPGVGPYTSAAIAAIAFDLPETVVDGNVERVVSRLFRVEAPLPAGKCELASHAETLTPTKRPGDYAQAIMDLGATICTPRTPQCDRCPLSRFCLAYRAGDQARFPLKSPKKPKPVRYGTAYVGRTNTGDLILEKRPETGLLGGTLGWLGSAWVEGEGPPEHTAPMAGTWQTHGEIKHVFTHFELRLQVKSAIVHTPPNDVRLIPMEGFDPKTLPTVMRKAFDLSQSKADQ